MVEALRVHELPAQAALYTRFTDCRGAARLGLSRGTPKLAGTGVRFLWQAPPPSSPLFGTAVQASRLRT